MARPQPRDPAFAARVAASFDEQQAMALIGATMQTIMVVQQQ